MYKTLALRFSLLLMIPNLGWAQGADGIACGNKNAGPIVTKLIIDEQQDLGSTYHIKLNESGEIPVVVHYARDPENNEKATSVSQFQVTQLFELLNKEFGEPFHFVVDKFIEVENPSLYNLEGDLDDQEYKDVYKMFRKNSEDDYKIHVYFPYESTLICGLSTFPENDEQGIIVVGNEGCAGTETEPKAQVLIHEFGHFFNLNHTFYNSNEWDKAEHVTRDSRCKWQGDGFCDTPADFYPSYLYQNFSNISACTYSPYNPNKNPDLKTALDMDGYLYMPSVHNHMSYFTKNCRNEFTAEQREMMKQAFYYRTYQNRTFPIFTVYPNPARPSDNIRINMDTNDIENSELISYQIKVMNSLGQEIQAQSFLNGGNAADVLNSVQAANMTFAASGTYLIDLVLTDIRTQQVVYQQTQKLIVIQ